MSRDHWSAALPRNACGDWMIQSPTWWTEFRFSTKYQRCPQDVGYGVAHARPMDTGSTKASGRIAFLFNCIAALFLTEWRSTTYAGIRYA